MTVLNQQPREEVVEHFREHDPDGFPKHAAGTWGPDASHELIQADGRRWGSESGAGTPG